jgi:predicted RNase H-like HicB family nuclease
MSARSKNTSAKNKRAAAAAAAAATAVDRPFDPAVRKRAREIAERYQVLLWFEDGEWYGRGVELPGAMADGRTPDECVANLRDAFTLGVGHMLETRRTPPSPAVEGARVEQVNIRLSAAERMELEELARQGGHRGIADYLRAAALGSKANARRAS